MLITDTYRSLEIGIWRNGQAQSPLYVHPWDITAGNYHLFRVQSNQQAGERFDVRVENRDGMVDGWLSGRMWLLDYYGQLMGPVAPTLIYTEPTDMPMTTVFPCTWAGDEARENWCGVWVVTTRVTQPARLLPPAKVG